MGTKITKKQLRYGDTELTLQIWDIVGNIIYRKLQAQYFRGSDGAFIVCDLSRRETVNNLLQWTDHYLKIAPQGKIIYIGNKRDLVADPKAAAVQLEQLSASQGTNFYLTSAMTGDDVESAFQRLGAMLLTRRGP